MTAVGRALAVLGVAVVAATAVAGTSHLRGDEDDGPDEACAAPCATLHRVTATCEKAANGSVATTCGACLPGFDGGNASRVPCIVNETYWTGDDDDESDSDGAYGAPHGSYAKDKGPTMSMQATVASAFGSLVVLLMCVVTWRGWCDCCSRKRKQERLRAFLKPTTAGWTCAVCLHTNSSLRRYCVLCKTESSDAEVDPEGSAISSSRGEDAKLTSDEYVLVETPRAGTRPGMSRAFSKNAPVEWTEEQQLARERLEWKRCIDKRTMKWMRFRAEDVCRYPALRGTIVRVKDLCSLELFKTSATTSARSTAPVTGFYVLQGNQAVTVWHPVEQAEFDTRPYRQWGTLQKIASMPFEDRLRCLYKELIQFRHTLHENQFMIHVHRQHILKQTMQLFETTPPSVLRRHLRVDFMDEPGVDGGGILREWLQLVCNELFSDAVGAFKRTASSVDGGYWISRLSTRRSSEQLQMYTFFGKLLAKALLEGLLLNVRIATPLLKHILGSPLSRDDLRFVDEQIYSSVCYIVASDNVEDLNLTFCVADQDLISHGSEINVTEENKQRYVEQLVQYYLFDSVEHELSHIVDGFRTILPTTLLHVFDHKELDLVFSGLIEIDVVDWRAHTNVCTLGHGIKQEELVIDWFWEIVEELDQRARSRLLQYVTGSSCVPVEGFAALTSLDGRLQPFTIQLRESVFKNFSPLPYASTCVNRLDLPVCETKSDLKQMILLLVEADVTGFNRR